MPYKDNAKQKEYQAAWYQENKQRISPKHRLTNTQIKRRNLRFLLRVKYRGCQICGYRRCPQAIDFHHLKDKKFEVGRGAGQMRYSIKKLKIEIRKCIRVCANCHREIHAGIIEIE